MLLKWKVKAAYHTVQAVRMKKSYLPLILTAAITLGCSDCRDDDCGGDDMLIIRVVSDREINYSDSIDFYYFDENQQKVGADIERSRSSSQTYYAYLDYRSAPGSYSLEVGNQTKTIAIQIRYDKDPCCGDYLRFEEITVNGVVTSLPVEVEID